MFVQRNKLISGGSVEGLKMIEEDQGGGISRK